MRNRELRFLIAKVLAVASLTGLSTVGYAQSGMSSGEAFQIGGSCAGLAYLNKNQISVVLAAAFVDDMHAFCYPEEPSECSDYSAFMQGAGKLTTSEDDFHCALSN